MIEILNQKELTQGDCRWIVANRNKLAGEVEKLWCAGEISVRQHREYKTLLNDRHVKVLGAFSQGASVEDNGEWATAYRHKLSTSYLLSRRVSVGMVRISLPPSHADKRTLKVLRSLNNKTNEIKERIDKLSRDTYKWISFDDYKKLRDRGVKMTSVLGVNEVVS